MRCKANNLNSKMKRNYFSNKIQSCAGDTKETWKTINQLVNKRSKTTEILSLKDGKHTISKPQDIAETMNKFFCNVGKDLSENIPNKENPLLMVIMVKERLIPPFLLNLLLLMRLKEHVLRLKSQMDLVLIAFLVTL